MGQRHLMGALGLVQEISLVEPVSEAREACCKLADNRVVIYDSLAAIVDGVRFDLIILSATAADRLAQFEWACSRTRKILVEKPLEQSRARCRDIFALADVPGLEVWINHYRRSLRGYDTLRAAGGPYMITVSSGAMGLGCNGIHWIDFALHLTGQSTGKLLFGEIDPEEIRSGRGTQFRDYGGRGLFAFPDGSRFVLSSMAASSAPTTLSIITPNSHWLIDQTTDRAFVHERPEAVTHPTYLYGKDYATTERSELESFDLSAFTRVFIDSLQKGREPPQPRLLDVAGAYDMLFDLLECSGQHKFDFT
jgi:predicted dehydrogenase